MHRRVSLLRNEYNTELIEIRIPSETAKRKFQFPDQQNLRDVKLRGLQTFTEAMVPISIVSDTVVPDLTFLKNVFVTLQAYNGENFIWQKPAITLINQEIVTSIENYSPNAFTNQRVNWPKSYVELSSLIVIPANDLVIIFEVNYIDKPPREKAQRESRFKKQS